MALHKRGIVNGRYYDYTIEEPTESEVNSEAQNLFEEAKAAAAKQARANGGRPDDVKHDWDQKKAQKLAEYKKVARSSFMRKKCEEKEKELGVFEAKHALLDDAAHAEPGISDLRFTEVKATDADSNGVITKDTTPADANGVTDRTVVKEEIYKEGPTKLVDLLIESRKEAQKKRLAKGGDNKAYVDSSIPLPDKTKPVREQYDDIAIFLSGAGRADSQYSQFVRQFDRFHRLLVPGSRELSGYTFITRPTLNMMQSNIVADRNFAAMLNTRRDSITYAIRMMLDPRLAEKMGEGEAELKIYTNPRSPFLVLLFNSLKSTSGWPDLTVGTETTEGGFFSEQQSLAIGQDRGAHGGELTLQFRDIEGGPVMALHDFWCRYIGNVMDGTFTQYSKDITRNLLGYTCSIYRIIVDYTGKRITRWAKATGCFPKQNPSGNVFNQNEGELVLNSVRDFSIQYQVNHFGYNDPIILKEFNMLIGRFGNQRWMDENTGLLKENPEQMDLRPSISNFGGTPYISQIHGYNELAWRYNDGDSDVDVVKA